MLVKTRSEALPEVPSLLNGVMSWRSGFKLKYRRSGLEGWRLITGDDLCVVCLCGTKMNVQDGLLSLFDKVDCRCFSIESKGHRHTEK